jgi:ABC-type branched-subunit amino acid transport system substrate-binding protein
LVGLSRKSRSSLVLSGTLLATLALVGCENQSPGTPYIGETVMPSLLGNGQPAAANPPAAGVSTGPVALLLPLSGPLQPVGQILENAAKLAIPGASPALDIRDTGGTAAGAAAAAQAAIGAGDGLILGPLTSAEAHAVAPIAQAAHISVLAFTNDSSVAGAGVWPLGVTPAQQVQRVLQVANDGGHNQIAALLPDTDFGHSLGAAIQAQAANAAAPNPSPSPSPGANPGSTPGSSSLSPSIVFYESGFSGLNNAVQSVSDFADRGQDLMTKIKAAQDLNTAAGREQARELQHQPIPPPPFNALFIGATAPEELAEIATLLPYYSVSAPQVQLLGPALWANLATAMASKGVYDGALYAAPDPAAAATFDAKYQSIYGAQPPAIADVAFDAAAIAKLLAGQGGYNAAALSNPAGFAGTDGVLQLQPDGQVQRGLAVFRIAPGSPVIASPAPATPAALPPSS